MKKLIGLLLLVVFVAAFGVGYLGSVNAASANPHNCTTTCDPARCPVKCASMGLDGSCVQTSKNCFKCVCFIPS